MTDEEVRSRNTEIVKLIEGDVKRIQRQRIMAPRFLAALKSVVAVANAAVDHQDDDVALTTLSALAGRSPQYNPIIDEIHAAIHAAEEK